MEKMGTINPDELGKFIFSVFEDCRSFLLQKLKLISFPTIHLKIVYNTEKYWRFEKEEAKKGLEMEVPKDSSTAFAIGNRFLQRVYVDAESLIKLSDYGYPTFIMNLSEIYIHELLHCFYRNTKTEQEIHDMQCPLIEEFIGIELPEEIKKLKASDYYESKS
jgi:hypothetical protein